MKTRNTKKTLVRIRKRHRLTQEDVANHLGITKKRYIVYEQDSSKLSTSMIIRLADLFDVSTDCFFGTPLRRRLKWYLMMHNPFSLKHYRYKYDNFDAKHLKFFFKPLLPVKSFAAKDIVFVNLCPGFILSLFYAYR